MNSAARILVVDDQASFLFMVKGYLADAGYEVACAGSAEEALQALEKTACDLVVSDLVMPEMDGAGLLRRVRQQWPQLPFILVTAHGSIDSRIHMVADIERACFERAVVAEHIGLDFEGIGHRKTGRAAGQLAFIANLAAAFGIERR